MENQESIESLKSENEKLRRESELQAIRNDIIVIARSEGEKGRNQALGILSLLTIVASLGVFGALTLYIKETLKQSSLEKYEQRAEETTATIDSIGREAKETSAMIDSIGREAEYTAQEIDALTARFTQSWTLVRLENKWSNWKNKETKELINPAAYIMDEHGRVYLKGLVQGGPAPSIIFKLPEQYQPQHNEIFTVKTENGEVRLDVETNGKVFVAGSYKDWVSLSGVNFGSKSMSN